MRGIGRTLAKQTKELKEKDAIIAEKDALIGSLQAQLASKNS